ncbi:hypothetical protein BU23DRAFT_546541 [Bimuria novae-zelandiae CBS 107.79]|uniref:EthD domain-containing protein n=1 Tax=Bimuria novae-zelandiae CBS 107.79 TaxID=1447943 RepID=A0A6A5UJG4_9PLEO|nr:hypothetical protein BU23DRAFT_546541 [Bimuria novae-zelandiae CBS 107.79]
MHFLATFALAVSFTLVAASPHSPRDQGLSGNSTATASIPAPTQSYCTRATPGLTNCSPDQCPHQYTFDEYASGKGSSVGQSNQQPYYRFLILFQVNKALCEEQAHEHWKTVHADLTLISKDMGIDVLGYVQFHADAAHKEALQPLVVSGSLMSTPRAIRWDGIAEFHAKDGASIQRFMSNVFANPALVNDQNYFTNRGIKLQVMVGGYYATVVLTKAGYDTLIFGSGIATSEGTDGVMPGDPRFN